MKLNVSCADCNRPFQFVVNGDDWRAWKNGRAIQHSLPYLSAEQRELLISGRCLRCFEENEMNLSDCSELWPL